MINPKNCVLNIRLTPKASCNKIVFTKEFLRIYVTDLPQDQVANQAACKLLAKSLKVSLSKVWIVSGHSCRDKKIQVEGLDYLETEKRLKTKWGYQNLLL